jgi:hypothetical protein
VLVAQAFKDDVRGCLEPGDSLMQFCIDAMEKELVLRKQRKQEKRS